MARIFGGLLITAGGFGLALGANWIYMQFGAVAFAENYLGTSGGTRLFYRLLGMLVIFFGFLMMTGLHDEFIRWVLSPLLRHTTPPPA